MVSWWYLLFIFTIYNFSFFLSFRSTILFSRYSNACKCNNTVFYDFSRNCIIFKTSFFSFVGPFVNVAVSNYVKHLLEIVQVQTLYFFLQMFCFYLISDVSSTSSSMFYIISSSNNNFFFVCN